MMQLLNRCYRSQINEIFPIQSFSLNETITGSPLCGSLLLTCIGWFDTVIVACLVSSVHFSCIVQCSLYHNMDVGIMWHCTLVSSTPSLSRGLFCLFALFWCWLSLGAPGTISLIEFYFIMIFIIIVVTIIAIFMAIHYCLNYTLGFL